MANHQISFRLNDAVPHEAETLELLCQMYPQGHHQAAKDIVLTFIKQGLRHPGANPYAAQEHYLTNPEIAPIQPDTVSTLIEPEVSPISMTVDTGLDDFEETPLPQVEGNGITPIEINFDA